MTAPGPHAAPALLEQAMATYREGRLDDARRQCEAILRSDDRNPDVWYVLGLIHQRQGDLARAGQLFGQALARGQRPIYWANLGNVFKDTWRLPEAEAAYRRALDLQPGAADVLNNLAVVMVEGRRFDEAEAAYRQALAARPGYVLSQFGLAWLLLMRQRHGEGWPLYEARHDPAMHPAIVVPSGLAYPRWQGEPLAGRSLVVWREQGFGDQIQFVRYLPRLKAMGAARVTLVCAPALADLFACVEGVDAVLSDPAQVPVHDTWCYLASLPLLADRAQAPRGRAYLRAPQARVPAWVCRLPAGPRVGLVWKGSPGHKNDANRSLPHLAALAPLWGVAGVAFVSLQKGAGEDEAARAPAQQPLVHLGTQMQDFADAAAIISQLDLVITIDSATAHLAGALGKACWLLLPSRGTDWRWGDAGEASAWYGSLRLFRQDASARWEPVIGEVAAALGNWRSQLKAS